MSVREALRREMEAAKQPLEDELASIERRRDELLRELDDINAAIESLSGSRPAHRLPAAVETVVEYSGKYRALWSWLCQEAQSQINATFADLEEVLGFPLPPSSHKHLPYWYGYDSSPIARAIRDAGWRAKNVNLQNETLELYRVAGGSEDLTIEERFQRAMINLYDTAKAETGYVPTRFLRMVTEQGGVAAARKLLEGSAVSDGFMTLWERGRLDLSVEALVLRKEFLDLFTPEERHTARSRLRQYNHELRDDGSTPEAGT